MKSRVVNPCVPPTIHKKLFVGDENGRRVLVFARNLILWKLVCQPLDETQNFFVIWNVAHGQGGCPRVSTVCHTLTRRWLDSDLQWLSLVPVRQEGAHLDFNKIRCSHPDQINVALHFLIVPFLDNGETIDGSLTLASTAVRRHGEGIPM